MEFNTSPRQLALQNQPSLLSAFSQVIESGVFLNGLFLDRFERQLESFFQIKHAVGLGSGHDALLLAITSLKLHSSDEILFPINAYPTAFAVCQSGLTPIGVDVDENGQLDATDLEKKCSAKSKVLIVVHLYGLVGKFEEILHIARKNHLIIIEDCAQSFGSTYRGKLTGTFGNFGCFSFYPTKNLGTLGDGGALLTAKSKSRDLIRMARSYGEERKYESEFVSSHSRLPELQAAALTIYLTQFSELAARRQQVFGWYQEQFALAKLGPFLRLLQSDPDSQAVPHLLVVSVKKRSGLQVHLQKNGIETLIHYPKSVQQVKAFQNFAFSKHAYPRATHLQESILSLPFHPNLQESAVSSVIQSIQEFYEA